MCCSKPACHRTTFDDEPKPDNDAENPTHLSFWKPFSLKFEKEVIEKTFRCRVNRTWHLHDTAAYSLTMLFVSASFREIVPKIQTWYTVFMLSVAACFASLQIWACFKNRDKYKRYRLCPISFVRVGMFLSFIALFRSSEAPYPTYPALFIACIIKSPAISLLSMALNHRLEFRYQLPIQTIAVLLGSGWISPFCQKCSAHPDVLDMFHQIGHGIDWLFCFLVFRKEPDHVAYPCWMMTSVIIAVMGFVIPCFLVFMTEVSARSAFLRSRLSQRFHSGILKYTNEAMRVGILAFFSAVLAVWLCFSTTRDLLL